MPSLSPLRGTPVSPTGASAALLVSVAALFGADTSQAQDPSRHQAFITSVAGRGDLGSWPDSDGEVGLRAGDAICRSRAAAGGLPNPQSFVAWLSDSSDDAYCRAHGLSGRIADNCGQSSLPTNAGPWVRRDGFPFGSSLASMMSPSYAALAPVTFNEFGQPTAGVHFSGTDQFGARDDDDGHCADWTDGAAGLSAGTGSAHRTGGSWNASGVSSCGSPNPLLCLQAGSGPDLGSYAQLGARAFLTTSLGTGDLSTWRDAGDNAGIDAADAVCRTEATRAGLHSASRFKAWLSTSSMRASDRFANDGPWVRLDGVPVAEDRIDLLDGRLFAPINAMPTSPVSYRHNAGVWTGTDASGNATGDACDDWTNGGFAGQGSGGSADSTIGWSGPNPASCDSRFRLYCLEDVTFAGCPQDPDTLCLGESERFAVTVDWQSAVASGSGQAVDIGRGDSGLFTFFDPNNLELLIKVLDGCAITDHYWVFYGATTDVAFQIRVEDVQTGVVREYTNSLGTSAEPIKDLMAFPCGG